MSGFINSAQGIDWNGLEDFFLRFLEHFFCETYLQIHYVKHTHGAALTRARVGIPRAPYPCSARNSPSPLRSPEGSTEQLGKCWPKPKSVVLKSAIPEPAASVLSGNLLEICML